jgi:carbamoylphosphate synthase small subunit
MKYNTQRRLRRLASVFGARRHIGRSGDEAQPAGVFLSSGRAILRFDYAVRGSKYWIPAFRFSICLGHQILGRALGAGRLS